MIVSLILCDCVSLSLCVILSFFLYDAVIICFSFSVSVSLYLVDCARSLSVCDSVSLSHGLAAVLGGYVAVRETGTTIDCLLT